MDEHFDISPITTHMASPAELQERLEVERRGQPFVILRDDQGGQRIIELAKRGPQTVGRSEEADVRIDWDTQVSRVHAELRELAGDWLVIDEGMSRNGTFVNGERVVNRRRLRDGDQLRLGRTLLVFREPDRRLGTTFAPNRAEGVPELSPAQKRVLVALCRPVWNGGGFGRPATNKEIAEALHLSVAAVKTHLRNLFLRFGLGNMPQNQKRARLAKRAVDDGAVVPADLDDHL